MALRPVSELGLVDLTDLASPHEDVPPRRKPRGVEGPKKSRVAQAKSGGRNSQQASPPVTTARSRRARINAASVSRVAILTATWAIGGTAGVLLGRAAVRR